MRSRAGKSSRKKSALHERQQSDLYSRMTIPSLQPFRAVRRKLRFQSTVAAGVKSISSVQMIMTGGAMTTVANSVITAVNRAFRLHSVEIWSAPVVTAGITLPTAIQFNWGGIDNSVGTTYRTVTDTTLDPTVPAHVFTKPPRGSVSSWWQQADNAELLFTFQCASAAVVEIDVSFQPTTDGNAGAGLTVAAATLGVLYYPSLDNTVSSGTADQYLPVGLPTTT